MYPCYYALPCGLLRRISFSTQAQKSPVINHSLSRIRILYTIYTSEYSVPPQSNLYQGTRPQERPTSIRRYPVPTPISTASNRFSPSRCFLFFLTSFLFQSFSVRPRAIDISLQPQRETDWLPNLSIRYRSATSLFLFYVVALYLRFIRPIFVLSGSYLAYNLGVNPCRVYKDIFGCARFTSHIFSALPCD